MITAALKEVLFGFGYIDKNMILKILKYYKKKEYEEFLEY